MTDSEWKKLITRTQNAYRKYEKLLAEAEKEYEERYGHPPSDADDDWWIDLMHLGLGDINLDEIKSAAEIRCNNFK